MLFRSEAGSRRPPPRNLRERLLHAAMEALGELNPAMILNAIGAREIARRAGSSPASLFHHYGSMQGLADAVVARVFDPSTLEIDGILDKLIGLIGDQFPLDAGLAVHRADLDRMIADPEFTLRMGLWAFGGPSVTEAYRDYLRGRAALVKYTPDGTLGAIAAFEAALKRDPDYALARAGLAMAAADMYLRFAAPVEVER